MNPQYFLTYSLRFSTWPNFEGSQYLSEELISDFYIRLVIQFFGSGLENLGFEDYLKIILELLDLSKKEEEFAGSSYHLNYILITENCNLYIWKLDHKLSTVQARVFREVYKLDATPVLNFVDLEVLLLHVLFHEGDGVLLGFVGLCQVIFNEVTLLCLLGLGNLGLNSLFDGRWG